MAKGENTTGAVDFDGRIDQKTHNTLPLARGLSRQRRLRPWLGVRRNVELAEGKFFTKHAVPGNLVQRTVWGCEPFARSGPPRRSVRAWVD